MRLHPARTPPPSVDHSITKASMRLPLAAEARVPASGVSPSVGGKTRRVEPVGRNP
jgi:hypothetical protein